MGRRTLKLEDKVKLSVRGLQVKQKGVDKEGIDWSRWKEAVSRNEKDVYTVEEAFFWAGRPTHLLLGSLVREGTFKFLKKKKGPLTGYIVKRDWVKSAK